MIVGVLSVPVMTTSFGMSNVIEDRGLAEPWDAVATILGLIGLVAMGVVCVQRSRTYRRLSPVEEQDLHRRQRRGLRGWIAGVAVGAVAVAGLILPPMLSDLPTGVALALPALMALPLAAFIAADARQDAALEEQVLRAH